MAIRTDRAGYQALRRGRWSQPSQIYLLTTVAHNRERLFAQWSSASVAASAMSEPTNWPGANLLCWVLMPDHWHGLVELSGSASLATQMKRVKGRSSHTINRAINRSGPVWMPGFHDRALRREDNLVKVAEYVIANPLRAGLVQRIEDYPYWDAVWLR